MCILLVWRSLPAEQAARGLQAALTSAPPRRTIDGVRYFVGLDLGLVRDRTARAVVHFDRDAANVVLDDLRTWGGTRAQPLEIAARRRP